MWRFFILLCILLFIGCSKKAEPQLRIAVVDWIGYAPLYIADYNNYLPKNVRLVFFPSNYDIVEALEILDIESAALTLDELLNHPEFPPMSVAFAIDYSNGADAIVSKTKEPFVNKRVAYEPYSVQEYLLHRALQEHNLTFNAIHPYPLKYNMVLDHIDKIDTAVVFEPIKSKLLTKGFRVVFDSSQIPMEIIDIFVIQTKYLPFYKNTLKKLFEAYNKGLAYLHRHPKKSAHIIARYLKSDPASVMKMLSGVKILDHQQNCQFFKNYPTLEKRIRSFTQKRANITLQPIMECRG